MALAAARTNLVPGLMLQCLMAAFLCLYVAHEGTRHFLGEVAKVRQEAGFAFSFLSYLVAGGLLPELLRIVFFQSGRPDRKNLQTFLYAGPGWGAIGILVDVFYRLQTLWFGDGHDWGTLLSKLFVDQALFSPFISNPLIISWFLLCESGFRVSEWRKKLSAGFWLEKVFPVQVAGWLVWIPGVLLVYSMPELLQIPVAVLIQVFWVLIFTTMEESLRRRTGG